MFFSPGVKIIVEAGGYLELKGDDCNNPARLTSGCNELWGGIEVRGDPELPQRTEYQGEVYIENGIIENAVCGIKAFNTGAFPRSGGLPAFDGIPSGGIIKAKWATFRNNKTAVAFFPYHDGNELNKSYFINCTFITDKLLLNEQVPDYFMKLDGVNFYNTKTELSSSSDFPGIIRGCVFENKTQNDYDQRGNGIYIHNSYLCLDKSRYYDICTSQIIEVKSSFNKLKYGIYGMHSGLGSAKITTNRCEFTDNNYGLYLSGFSEINPVTIHENEFSFQNNAGANNIYKLYLNNCTGFRVDKNNFSGTNGLTGVTQFGCIVNNSGTNTNYIYNNNFSILDNALQGQNYNTGYGYPDYGFPSEPMPEYGTGLHFVCNDFTDCENDIFISEDVYPSDGTGISYFQKNLKYTEPRQEPAGNVFSSNHTNPYGPPYDINIDADCQKIQYSYHSSTDPYGLRVEPVSISNNSWVIKDLKTVIYKKGISCPSSFYLTENPEIIDSIIDHAENKIDSLLFVMNQLIDGGSTDTLRENVENSDPNQSYSIYQDLMTPSPYLSDTVLKTSIEKEDVLPNAMIRDIMVANPQSAKNDDLLNALDNRITPMPDSMWVEIMDGRDTIRAKEQLESELVGWIQTRDFYFNCLLNLYLNDSSTSRSNDSVISLLNRTSRLNVKYYLVNYYIDKHDFDSASDVLDYIDNNFSLNINEQFVHQKYISLITVLQQLSNDTVGYTVPDSLQTFILHDLVSEDYDLPGAFARNILIANGLLNYQEPVITETSLKFSRNYFHYGINRQFSGIFKIYPNPCKDYIIVEYSTEIPENSSFVNLFDRNGKFLYSYLLNGSSDQVVIPLTQYSPGVFFIKIILGGIIQETKQIILVK